MRPTQREQRVVAAPPLIYFAGLLAALVLQVLLPIPLGGPLAGLDRFGSDHLLVPRLAIGGPVFALGFALNSWAVLALREARTTIVPWGEPTSLVTNGPYRHSRNPMYVGLTIGYVGLGIIVGNPWTLVLLPVVIVVVSHGVTRREEAHVAWRFGKVYAAYRARVRRWV